MVYIYLVDFQAEIEDVDIARIKALLGERALANLNLFLVSMEMEKTRLVLSRFHLTKTSLGSKRVKY